MNILEQVMLTDEEEDMVARNMNPGYTSGLVKRLEAAQILKVVEWLKPSDTGDCDQMIQIADKYRQLAAALKEVSSEVK